MPTLFGTPALSRVEPHVRQLWWELRQGLILPQRLPIASASPQLSKSPLSARCNSAASMTPAQAASTAEHRDARTPSSAISTPT